MQSLMFSLSETIVAMADFYYIFLKQKEKAPRNKNRNNGLCNMKSRVNHFLQSCSEFLKILFF